jgi:hypothetical protein
MVLKGASRAKPESRNSPKRSSPGCPQHRVLVRDASVSHHVLLWLANAAEAWKQAETKGWFRPKAATGNQTEKFSFDRGLFANRRAALARRAIIEEG